MREGGANNLLASLAEDARIPFTAEELRDLIGKPMDFTGESREQVSRVVARIEAVVAKHPKAATYKPAAIR
jgi:adenylosuccinate lyase